MHKLFCFSLLALIAWVAVPRTAEAAGAKAGSVDAAAAVSADSSPTELAAAPKKADEVKVPKDKPKRSKKNPNDDKDEDPDDGNAGGGNDDKTLPKDGPAND